MRVLNFGSLNLDYVYAVDHFVQPGETVSSESRNVKCGGKGLNQSVALARAGAETFHAGCVGNGGEPLREALLENGVDITALRTVPEMQGHTVIQVTPEGENSIILYGGSNRCVTEAQVRETLDRFSEGDWLVLQNEINLLPYIIREAHVRGMRIVLNPSPCDEKIRRADLSAVSWLLLNEVEAEQITGFADPDRAWEQLHARWPALSAVITLGKQGSVAYEPAECSVRTVRQAAFPARPVDTTGAGDTFTGYLVAGMTQNLPLEKCMERAAKAAAISVTRPGAADSIPRADEIE